MKKEATLLLLLVALTACAVQQPVSPEPQKEVIPVAEEKPFQVPEIKQPPVPCTDTDEGRNEFVKGTAQNQTNKVADSCLFLRLPTRDMPLQQVAEYSCEENRIVAEIIKCEHGCEEGACLATPKPLPPVYLLIEDGNCRKDLIANNAIKVTMCYNDCLSQTACDPAPLKTKHVTLPAELSCLARTDNWVLEKWLEFEVLKPVTVIFEANVAGSEAVLVEVRDSQGKLVAAPIDNVLISENRCFGEASGSARAELEPGKYQVIVGAKAEEPHLLRSFRGQNFAVSFMER